MNCSVKGKRFIENTYDEVFLVNQRVYFSIKKIFIRAPINENLCVELEKLEVIIRNKKGILCNSCSTDLTESVFI